MKAATEYLYDHVTPKVLMEDMAFGEDAPRPGDRLPEFDLPSVDGEHVRSADLVGKRPVLLVTGSYSCPMTASSDPLLKELYEEFRSDIDFVMVHVREAHPGERREQPRSMEEKIEHARALKARDQLPWPIAVDEPDGRLHRALDEKPNAVWLADRNGFIVYRGLWAGDETSLAQALHSVARGELPKRQESVRRVGPMAMGLGKMREMTRESGPRAQRDLWRSAPPMAAVAWLADLYRPLPPKWRTFAALATIGVAIAALTSGRGGRATRTRRD